MAPAATPSAAALSPMKQPTDRALQRHVTGAPEETQEGSWTNGIFSPVLKYLGADEEAARQAAANSSASGHSGSLVNLHSPDGRAAGVASPAARGYAAGVGVGSSPSSASVDNLRQRVAAVTVADAGYSPTAGYAARGARGSPVAATAAGTPPSGASGARAAATAAHNAAAIATAQRQQAIAAAQAAAAAAAEEEEYEEFNPYLFIKMLPPYTIAAPRVPVIALPPKLRRMPEVNLVLDLDETLVHCSVDPIPDPDVTFPVTFNGAHYDVYVRKRPFLDRFFAAIAGKFEVTVFTASQQVYAEKLLNLLDPAGVHIHHRLYRDSCLNVEGNYLKDLNVLGRDLSKTVLVDNSPHAFGYQLDNGIPIESWFEDPKDSELLKLAAFLHTLVGAPDVRPLVRDKFKVHRLVEEAKPSSRRG